MSTLLNESLDIVNITDYRLFEADLYRTKGELLLLKDEAEAEVEACYEKALKSLADKKQNLTNCEQP